MTWNRPLVMGVINHSPNSFYAPLTSIDQALRKAEQMVAEGADLLDIGGEATNPFVSLEDEKPDLQVEIDRVVPTIAAIKQRFNVLVSVDTSEPEVMAAAIQQGADLINFQKTVNLQAAVTLLKEAEIPVCLMHFFHPARIPESSTPESLLLQIKNELAERVAYCLEHGISSERIIIDPGFGGGNYGKNTPENYYLLKHQQVFLDLGYPLLAGWSRKSMIGDTLAGAPPEERLYASIAAATIAGLNGAAIIRTHDVKATVDAMKVLERYHEA